MSMIIDYEVAVFVDFTVVLLDLKLAGICHREVSQRLHISRHVVDRIGHGQEPKFRDGCALMRLHMQLPKPEPIPAPKPKIMRYIPVNLEGVYHMARWVGIKGKRLQRRCE